VDDGLLEEEYYALVASTTQVYGAIGFVMKIQTSRFGSVEIAADDILFFSNGLFGFESSQHWVILGDGDNPAVAWLQSVQNGELALPVVAPRRFVPNYQVRLEPAEVERLKLTAVQQAYVLGIVSRDEDVLTINLRAPIVINLDRRLGSQVITVDHQPIRYELAALPIALRKSA
jgi:flagellar assembly factor FliW